MSSFPSFQYPEDAQQGRNPREGGVGLGGRRPHPVRLVSWSSLVLLANRRSPRRDVADEPKHVVKQRRRDIASIAVDGAWLVAQSTQQPVRPSCWSEIAEEQPLLTCTLLRTALPPYRSCRDSQGHFATPPPNPRLPQRRPTSPHSGPSTSAKSENPCQGSR